MRAAISEVASWGRVVGLVNNAGAHRATPSAQLEAREIEETMRLNAIMPFVACRETFPHLKASGSGLIVNIGSFFDKLGVPGNVAYCASKAAVGAMTRCLAAEWAPDRRRFGHTGRTRDPPTVWSSASCSPIAGWTGGHLH